MDFPVAQAFLDYPPSLGSQPLLTPHENDVNVLGRSTVYRRPMRWYGLSWRLAIA